MKRAASVALIGSLLACGSAPVPAPAGPTDPTVPVSSPAPAAVESLDALLDPIDPASTFLQPNVRDQDGVGAFVHVTRDDMPLRIAIGFPPTPPRGGSARDARAAAIEAMQLWERPIQQRLPWFRLEFVEHDPSAAVQVIWKRRISGPYAGWGGLRIAQVDGRLRVGGQMEISTTPDSTGISDRLSLDELRLLVAHEFGHVLGLGHCLDCDSAMNYSWETLERVVVTDLDVRTFVALVQKPNGMRTDGRIVGVAPEPR